MGSCVSITLSILLFSFVKTKQCFTFGSNKTHHASLKNSAPGWVFDFYRANKALSIGVFSSQWEKEAIWK